MKKSIVFGTFSVDLMGRASHLPIPGETVKGSLFQMGPGGKGFNQGVAAHKSGADVTMVTKLGKDSFADVALNMMTELNMDQSQLMFTDQHSTGAALILVDENTSQNSILTVQSACDSITDDEIECLGKILPAYEFLLIQLETSMSSIEKMVDLAKRYQLTIILNTAPIQKVSDELLSKVDIVTPNEIEAEALTGIKIENEEAADKAASVFFDKGVKIVVITLGSKGVYINTKYKKGIIPAYQVDAVDTTGAGDAFNGALLTGLSEGLDIWKSAEFANAAAALSVQRMGAALSMPDRKEIDAFLNMNKASL